MQAVDELRRRAHLLEDLLLESRAFDLEALRAAEHLARANEALLAALAKKKTLGEATIAAQRATSDADVRRTLILFGDPMMKMR